MSHFGLIAPPYLGHLNPMQALAGELVRRGHRATFFGISDAAGAIDRSRFAFVDLGRTTHEPGTLARLTSHLADPHGLKLFRILRDMGRMTTMLCRELPAAVKAIGVDALLVDQLEPAGGLMAEAASLPFVSVANALLIDRDPAIPPPFTDWDYDPSPRGLARVRGGYRVADFMMAGYGRVVAREAVRLGLPARRRAEECLSPLLTLSQTVEGFDFPRQAPAPTLHHCGPLRGPEEQADLSGLRSDARPLVFASLGTLQGGRIDAFRQIAEVCAAKNLHLVIAHGGRLADGAAAALPGQPIVRAFVPQRALMRHASLVITSGGLNTVMDSLAAGVPLVVLPVAFEQGAIAARVRRAGAGLAVPLRRLTRTRLDTAVSQVLNDLTFAEQAKRLAGDIQTAGGVASAADLIAARLRSSSTRPEETAA